MTPDEVGATKAHLRSRLREQRRARSAPERATAAAAVTSTLLRGLAGVRTIAAFAPDQYEPGHGRLPAAFTQLGARVLLPVLVEGDPELRWAVDSGRLAPGRHGLMEPVGPRLGATAVGTADAVVVPAVAVDRSGVRLGRGGGFYDRALVHARPGAVLVAVVYDDEFLDELPMEPHDQRVGVVVTPSGGWQVLSAGA